MRGRRTVWGALFAWAFGVLMALGLFGFVKFLVYTGLLAQRNWLIVFLVLALIAVVEFSTWATSRRRR